MAPPTKKPAKPIFKTSSPFSETKWPFVSHEDQEIITELLCKPQSSSVTPAESVDPILLSPLGEHRRTNIQPSKGKKRKRESKDASEDAPHPAVPAIGSHVLVGLNSVTRHLEALAAKTAPTNVPAHELRGDDNKEKNPATDLDAEKQQEPSIRPLSMVILTHPQPSLSPSHAHIPTLLHLATLHPTSTTGPSETTRLISLPTFNDQQIASALHIPRVGAIGIYEDAPGAKALEEYARQHIGLTECPWIEEALEPKWRGLNVQQA